MGVRRRPGLIVVLALGLAAGCAHAITAADSGQRPDPALRRALEQALEGSDSFANRFDAEVWLMDMSTRLRRRIPDPDKRLRFLKLLHYEARRADLEPEWVLALIDVESDFRRFAISSAGARGYMQIMPFWLEELDRPDGNLFRPALNLRMGCTILRHYLNIENGNLTRALARYNGSLGQTWYPERVFRALRRRWHPQ